MFDVVNIRDICAILDMEDQIWSEFMKHSEPRVMCPFKKNVPYVVTNAPIDMGFLSHLPIDGYTWTFTEKMFKTVKGRKTKRMVYCEEFEITITKNRPNKKGTQSYRLN